MLFGKAKKGFTLVELLVVISIIALLLAIIVPALGSVRKQAKSVICSSNLSQLGLGFDMYLSDNNRRVFPLAGIETDENGQVGMRWYFGFEPGSSFSLPEGQRLLRREKARLYPYLEQYDSIEICPSFPYAHGRYKPKYQTKWMTYGANCKLFADLREPGRDVVNFDNYPGSSRAMIFSDSAQVNTHQSPASPANPMFEEWHVIEQLGSAFVHFRHKEKANILFGDGHVGRAAAEPGSYDHRLSSLKIGRFGPEVAF